MLSIAQAVMVERVHAVGFVALLDQSWCGEVYERATKDSLVAKGILVEIEPHNAEDTREVWHRWALTEKGRRTYARDGQVMRKPDGRCDNPLCCGVWAEELPPTHGSCPVCGRWASVAKDGTMRRHNYSYGSKIRCPGVGRLNAGHPDAGPQMVDYAWCEALFEDAARAEFDGLAG